MPAVTGKTFFEKDPFAYLFKPLFVYITCIAQYTAPIIQSLVLLDRLDSLQLERRMAELMRTPVT